MKCLVKNALGDKVLNMYLPMSSANAFTLMESVGEGTYKVFELLSLAGTDNTVFSANDCQVQVRDSATGKKAYLRFIAKSSKNPDEIQTALTGLTVNGILINEVVIISFRPMVFA